MPTACCILSTSLWTTGRAELGVFELKIKKGNAYRLIRENFLYYDKLARHKEIHYAFHSDLEEKEELFDPNYLELIVNNLLSNAFKYTDNGKSITVTLKEENNWLILQVSDTGAGIPINKQGKVFERFYQIESQHIGSGIGLSLVQRLVDLHHGRIELESEEGKGSTFSVYLRKTWLFISHRAGRLQHFQGRRAGVLHQLQRNVFHRYGENGE